MRIQTERKPRFEQKGVVLVVALVLLIFVTLLGLASIRGSSAQQKMTSNFYDRQIAFQTTEAALRVAAEFLQNHPSDPSIRDCSSTGGNVCQANPFEDLNLSADSLKTVPRQQFAASDMASGQPQYVIENMGTFADPERNPRSILTANSLQQDSSLGGGGFDQNTQTNNFYRITARSGDPSALNGRSMVVLQVVIRQ